MAYPFNVNDVQSQSSAKAGQLVKIALDFTLPTTYKGEAISRYVVSTTTALTANSASVLATATTPDNHGSSTRINGTNMVCHTAIAVYRNGYTAPSGTTVGDRVQLSRSGTNSPPDADYADAMMIDALAVSVPIINVWSTSGFYIISSTSATYQVDMEVLYYTPS